MDQTPPTPPTPASPESGAVEHCYRHPAEETRVHCTRCGKPICPECMIAAPVGHQCPECVAEARNEFRAGATTRAVRTAKGASATKVLLVLIIGMFLVEILVGGSAALLNPSPVTIYKLGGSYAGGSSIDPTQFPGIVDGQYWRLVSSIFLHWGLLHLAFNCWALWLFGSAMERVFGRWKFLALFFVTGFVASATSFAFGPLAVGAGASGAIFGIFGAFIAYNYRRRHTAMGAANLRSAVLMIVLNAFLALSFSAIDWRAHVGGAITGFVAGLLIDATMEPRERRGLMIAGLVTLVAIGAALVVWRTDELRTSFASGIAGLSQ